MYVGGMTNHWKALNEAYNFSLNLTSIRGLHKKLWASKMAKVPISRISRLSTWDHWGNDIWMHPSWLITKNNIQGKVVVSPSLGRGESCEFMYAHDLFVHQKCSNYALTSLLFGLYRFIWITDPLVTRPNPHLKALACPSYPRSVAS